MKKQHVSRMCFICGRENPVGLKLDFYEDLEAGWVRAEFSLPPEYQGYPGIAHGGIVAAILDETAGRVVMMEGGEDNFMVTLKLSVRYRQPTPTETPLVAVGRLERMGGVGARVSGEILLPGGTVSAECDATLGKLPEALRRKWAEEAHHWKVCN